MTAFDLEGRLAFWQRLLRLQDWDIEATIVRRHVMQSSTSLASADIEKYRRAKIRLLDPIDWNPQDWPTDRDLEVSLVHELLHCAFHDAGTPKADTPEDVGLERAIEATAVALVTLERRAAAA